MPKNIAVIGGGPGGYVAAIRAAQLGAKVSLFEKDTLGGTCTNRGCIPTKTLLESAGLYARLKKADELGISVGQVSIDYPKIVQRKNKIAQRLAAGVEYLMKKNNVQVIKGSAFLPEPLVVGLEGSDEKTGFDEIILATGSKPAAPPIKGAEGKDVLDSDGVLEMTELPQSVVIIGGGYVGLEFCQLFSDLGCKTTVVEMMPQLIPNVDADIAQMITRLLKRKRVEVFTGAAVTGIKDGPAGKMVSFETEKGLKTVEAQKVMIVVGRRPQTQGLGLDQIGVRQEKGRVAVNEYMETNLRGVYAVGDVVGGIMLAHVAMAEAECAVENIFGLKNKIDYRAVPSCIYTTPEIAGVGLTEKQAKETQENVKSVKFPYQANGRAVIGREADGFVKVVAREGDGQILGVHMIGPHATELIAEAALAMQTGASAQDIARTIHPHPTVCEAIKEAALGIKGAPIHI